jgi:hypothetical protein
VKEKDAPEQAAPGFPNSPFRTVHDHSFAGVDYPLDDAADGNDPQKDLRRALLQENLNDLQGSAASLQIVGIAFDGINLAFTAQITNQNSGHNLPTGFAFTRQMYMEIVVRDNDGNRLAQSGELQDGANDLCDATTLKDVLGPFVSGCANNVPDDQLVNFQTQLVDFVALDANGVLVKDAVKGHEHWLQFQSGGAVARIRPIDQQNLGPLLPFEQRDFVYNFVLPAQDTAVKLSAKLNFRNLPPYFVRKLSQSEASGVGGGLKPLLSSKAFQIVTMTSQFLSIDPQL